MAKARDGGSAETELHGMAFRHVCLGPEQHPRHHALDVFKLQRLRLADAHGALHPGRAQVQVAHAVGFGHGGRRKVVGGVLS